MAELKLAQLLEKALAREETYSLDDIIAELKAGNLAYIGDDKNCFILQIIQSPRKKWCNVLLAAGELEEVMTLSDKVFEYAKLNGCTEVRTQARFGWLKEFKKRNWKPHAIVVKVDI